MHISKKPLDVGASTQKPPKTIRLMRHGTTEMNEYLRRVPYNSPNFKDPLYHDTRLTASGKILAQEAEAVAKSLTPEPELLVISPLTRALQTASYAYLNWYQGKVIVEPLARERVWLSSDTGRSPEELAHDFQDFKQLSFENLPPVWWYTGRSKYRDAVELEPQDVFQTRVQEFKAWLTARPETCIAVVAHWGLLYELTDGVDFANCEIRSYHIESDSLVPLDMNPTEKQRRQQEGRTKNWLEAAGLVAAVLMTALYYCTIL